MIGFRLLPMIPQDLKICFIDVGQGDCTFITTPNHKTILIDGGGNRDNEVYDVVESVLLPYLLSHHTKTIDVIFVSHFDADHYNGLIAILEKLTVKRFIIGKQEKTSEGYNEIMKIAKEKKISVQTVQKGDRIKIEDNLFFDVLYPEQPLTLQGLNNNSLVLKLNYGNFNMLFTGDIEKEAEAKILEAYRNTDMLKATLIKLAHHGSKTSTTEAFLTAVNPQIAFIRCRKK